MKYVLCSLISIVLLAGGQTIAQFKIQNPILSGFYPDPSICKVGNDYYLVTSTFSYFPGLPIFYSRDLKNWKQVGNVIDRPTQMDFMGEQVSRGLFAPAISYHNGKFYVTCTDIDNGGNFVVTADKPEGPWSDPVWIKEVRGIDPSLFFDGEKSYIIYNSEAPHNKPLYDGHRTLRMYEFDAKNLKVIGSEIQLVNGGVDLTSKPVWIEGPHIYKWDDYYYLMAAEGGTSVNHSEVVLRSKTPKGPYLPYEKNPILTQRHLDPSRKNPITSTGHADIVEGPDGMLYAVFIAVRPYEGNFYNTGRETFIAPVKRFDGWPVINPDFEEIQYSYPIEYEEQPHKKALPMSGNFEYRIRLRDKLDKQFLFLRTHDSSWYEFKDGKLNMKLLPETIMGSGNPAFIGKRQQHLNATASTSMHFKPSKEGEQAGLMIFQNEFHFYFIAREIKDRKEIVSLYKGNYGAKTMDLIHAIVLESPGEKLSLKIHARKEKYDFWYAERRNKWKILQRDLDGKFLSTQVAGGFVGALFALYGSSNGQDSDNSVSFKWLDYQGNDDIHRQTR